MRFLFIQDRESEKWFYSGALPFENHKEYVSIHSNRQKTVRIQRSWVYPKPENVSAFIKAHKIIEANTEEEAKCQILS